ncbi:hypothetical protein G7Z17_g13106 [Cylindrodendrum hubeiense]|uniref:Uncharacterized protein n=1 Tax=Cylindrodendrum hubeiense TaxID=595255 RepID=A0A9P5GXL9_9HYPO|nr:hypothetical protein G7Z17_g13106 [Cylindrodendrum hubeiense]
MSQPREKDQKTDIVVSEVGGDVGSKEKTESQNEDTPIYVESKRSWKSYFWSTLDVPKEEARFLTKLDLTLISSSALGVMCRYLDQANINNAFNSGMKEDLSLFGNELNYANAVWSAAYVFGQVPSNLLLTRVNAPLYIAFLELGWTIFTFATAGVQNVNQLYVFRFLIFTQEEVELARARMPTEAKPRTGLFKWKHIKRWHTTWHVYLLIFWVKSYNVEGQPPVFSVPEINIIPLGINIISIFCTLLNSWISDSLPGSARWPGMLFASTMAIIFPTALASTPVHPPNKATRWALYYLTALGGTAAGITWTWVNEVNRDDPEKRAYVSALLFQQTYAKFGKIDIVFLNAVEDPEVNFVNDPTNNLVKEARTQVQYNYPANARENGNEDSPLKPPITKIFDVNITGYMYGMKLAVHYLVKNPGGRIIVFGSSTPYIAIAIELLYVTSKYAELGLVRATAQMSEFRDNGISIGFVVSFLVRSPLTQYV